MTREEIEALLLAAEADHAAIPTGPFARLPGSALVVQGPDPYAGEAMAECEGHIEDRDATEHVRLMQERWVPTADWIANARTREPSLVTALRAEMSRADTAEREADIIECAAASLLESLGEYVRQSMTLNREWCAGVAAVEQALLARRKHTGKIAATDAVEVRAKAAECETAQLRALLGPLQEAVRALRDDGPYPSARDGYIKRIVNAALATL